MNDRVLPYCIFSSYMSFSLFSTSHSVRHPNSSHPPPLDTLMEDVLITHVPVAKEVGLSPIAIGNLIAVFTHVSLLIGYHPR